MSPAVTIRRWRRARVWVAPMKALNDGRAGRAIALATRISDHDERRVRALARQLRLSRSAAARAALRLGLSILERDAERAEAG